MKNVKSMMSTSHEYFTIPGPNFLYKKYSSIIVRIIKIGKGKEMIANNLTEDNEAGSATMVGILGMYWTRQTKIMQSLAVSLMRKCFILKS